MNAVNWLRLITEPVGNQEALWERNAHGTANREGLFELLVVSRVEVRSALGLIHENPEALHADPVSQIE
jgi:hypothetical protein